MRVITGSARGKRLRTLDGLEVRPTSDKVKEAVFSIIQFDVPGASVLDLFSGSGQLGIEALSRGAEKAYFIDNSAKSCVFVDRSRQSVECSRENIESCGFTEQSKTVNADVLEFLKRPGEYDIILLDPPYRQGLIEKALPLLGERLAQGGIIVCEHEGELVLPEKIGSLVKKKDYSYGKNVALTTYRSEE